MQKQCPSSLHTHMCVLDEALAEVSALAIQEEVTTPAIPDVDERFVTPTTSFDEVLSLTLDRSKVVNVTRLTGEYEEFCASCFDGGDLLCCELCPNVYHRHCLPQLVEKDPAFFVCHACIFDVHALKSIDT